MMITKTTRLLIRSVQSGHSRRLYTDWNAMTEAFGVPSQAKPIRRNQSSAAVPSSSPLAPPLAKPSATATTATTAAAAAPVKPAQTTTTQALGTFGMSSLNDSPATLGLFSSNDGSQINWSDSFHGLGTASFDDKIQTILSEPISSDDIEITPDGLLYLPEIKYRRVLNKSFGAGGWGLAPRSETMINKNGLGGTLTREYALICQGRLVGIARGEQDYFSEKGIPTASEGCKSNALMRCCKDLGIASELWDPKFIRVFKKKYCEEVFVEHVVNKRKKKIWKRKDGLVEYPFKKT